MDPLTIALLSIGGGALLGGGIGAGAKGGKKGLSDFFMGRDPSAEKLDAFSPEQKQYQNQLLQQLSQSNPQMMKFLQKFLGDDEESLNEYSAPFLRQFNTKVVPGITERFAGGGDTGASSGLMNALGEAGTDLQERLASSRQQMGFEAVRGMQGLNAPAMQSPFGYAQYEGNQGAIQGILNALGGMGRR